jgi:hypothetical protein
LRHRRDFDSLDDLRADVDGNADHGHAGAMAGR